MSLLDTLKSLLGLGPSGTRDTRTRDVDVTVEHDPGETDADTGSEDAVKGTDEPASPTVEHDTDEAETDDGPADTPTADDAETAETAHAEAADAEAADPETDDSAGAAETDDADDAEEPAAGTDESTDVIKGIGPSYADRLAEAGVETVADLAAADPADLAEATDISEKRLGRWVDRAKAR